MRRRRRAITTSIDVGHRMLRTIFSLQQRKTHIKQVCSYFPLFSLKHHRFFASLQESQAQAAQSASTQQTNKTLLDQSPILISGISKSVISRCSHLLDKKDETLSKASLKGFLLCLSNFSPKTIRKFWRISELRPEDVLELLLGFEFNTKKFEVEVKKTESLWGMFKWASKQSRGFKHLRKSFEVMASMLVRVGLFRDVEFLLSAMEIEGILLDNQEVFSNLIEWHVGANELEKGISMYDRMMGLNLVPPLTCYRVLLDYVVRKGESQLAVRVYEDMLEMCLGMGKPEKDIYENVIQLLCRDGKIQEARNVIKKAFTFGMEPSYSVLDAIASGYCEKKDYDDLLSFFAEMKCSPDVVVGNKIIFSLCRSFCTEEAYLFMEELEDLGYCPDEITFAILVGCSCREGKLKNAFIYLSDILLRGLTPHIYSYNALISGVFKEGLWNHARDIVDEMDDKGIRPDLSTFKVLLAGYCEAKQFDDVKVIVREMVKSGLIQLSSLEDPLSKAFTVLGLNPLVVRVRRDNDVGFSKTEFYDNMGNGLYLETDVLEYEKTMTRILDESMIPDYNSLILKEGGHKNFRTALVIVDDLVHWGQELSLSAFSMLLKRFLVSNYGITTITNLLKKFPNLHIQLDQETLNILIQAHIKKGFIQKAWTLCDEIVKRSLQIENKTSTALITSLCKKGNLRDLHDCWKLVQSSNLLPSLEDYKTLFGSLCFQEMMKEELELFESALLAYPHKVQEISQVFLEKLCGSGLTRVAHVLLEELLARGSFLDGIAYSHLIRGFCKEGCFQEALFISDKMLGENMAPYSDVSVLLIPQLCRHDYFDRAIGLKDICLKEESSVSLSVHCALMSGFFDAGMVGKAASLYQEMIIKKIAPNSEVYNNLVQGYSKAKDLKKVAELLGVIVRNNVSISISSYRMLVCLMCMEGRTSFALCIKELMLKETNSSNLIVYNILIFYLFSSGNSEIVDRLLDEIQEKELEWDGVSYNFLVYGFSQCKAVSRSHRYLTEMMSKGLRPRNRCLRAVVSSLCYEGMVKEVLKLSLEMETRGWVHCSSVQSKIVRSLLNNGKLQEAVYFLDQMVEKDLIPDYITYDDIIKQLSCYGRQEKAIDLLDIMLKKGNMPNSTSYDYIIEGLCACQKFEEALGFHNEMLERDLKPSVKTWDILIHKLCEVGKTADAEILLHSLIQTGEIPSRGMFGSVVSRYRSENNLVKKSELLQMMQQCGYEPDFESHWSLISTLSKSQDKDKRNDSRSFISRLLSDSGFATRKDPKDKSG